MAKKQSRKKTQKTPTRSPRLVLGVIAVASIGILAGLAYFLPNRDSGPVGVGADGFSVFEKKGADLGVTKVVSKDTVKNALGKNVKSVSDVEKSGVISLNGNLGQTATYNFILPDGSKGWIDVDLLQYRNQEAYNADNVFKGTGQAGKINGREVRYSPATTLGKDRLYTLLVTEGTKSYRFIMSQPTQKVQIREYKAQDILKAIIAKAEL